MKATFPGEYVHCIIIELSTQQDGNAIVLISVDNFYRYCFSDVVASQLTFEKLGGHLDSIIKELRKRDPLLVPTFILGYADKMQFQLKDHFEEKAHFVFDETKANEIAGPVVKDLFRHISQQVTK